MKGPLPEPAGESVRDDLVMLVAGQSRQTRMERYGKVTACLLPELLKDDRSCAGMYQGVIEPRREVMREVLRRGIATGELRADLDVELTLLMLSGPDADAEHAALEPPRAGGGLRRGAGRRNPPRSSGLVGRTVPPGPPGPARAARSRPGRTVPPGPHGPARAAPPHPARAVSRGPRRLARPRRLTPPAPSRAGRAVSPQPCPLARAALSHPGRALSRGPCCLTPAAPLPRTALSHPGRALSRGPRCFTPAAPSRAGRAVSPRPRPLARAAPSHPGRAVRRSMGAYQAGLVGDDHQVDPVSGAELGQ